MRATPSRKKRIASRSIAGVSVLLVIFGVAVDEIAPKFAGRDFRNAATEVMVFLGLAGVCLGIFMLSGERV